MRKMAVAGHVRGKPRKRTDNLRHFFRARKSRTPPPFPGSLDPEKWREDSGMARNVSYEHSERGWKGNGET